MATHTFTPHPILKCFQKISLTYHGWNPSAKEKSKWFISQILPYINGVEKFSKKELRAWVSNSAEEINEILKKEGFDIRLHDLRPGETAFLSILQILLKWITPGTECVIRRPGDLKEYPGVFLRKGFQVLASSNHADSIICIQSKNGDQVFMTIADEELKDFKLFKKIEMLDIGIELAELTNISSVKFPMIDLDQQPDISWLQGTYHHQEGVIAQAKQQTKFKMNEKGALLESAVAITTMKCCLHNKKEITINQPFYLWIKRPGVSLPIFCAYMDTASWKKPDLDVT
ncbi:hypothetical protein ACFL2R_01355 [Patescibacteria group bacterium]